MCGIIGLVAFQNFEKHKDGLVELLLMSRLRGRDGFGWASWYPGTKLSIQKHLVEDARPIIEKLVSNMSAGERLIFGARAAPVTEGGVCIENTLPFISENWGHIPSWAYVHNGIISNDKEIVTEFNLHSKTSVDSEIIPLLRDKMPLEDMVEVLIGGFACCGLSRQGRFEVWRNYKTLWQAVIPNALYVVASEKKFLLDSFPDAVIMEFPTETYFSQPANNPRPNPTPFNAKYLAHTPELDRNKALVVLSGGMDSTLVAFVAKKIFKMGVELIHFNYGQKSEMMEFHSCLQVAKALESSLKMIDLDWLGEFGASPLTDPYIDVPLGRESSKTSLCWVPGRNLVMLSAAVAYAESKGIGYVFYGSNLEEEGPAWKDNDQAAVEAFDKAAYFGTLRGVKIFNVLGRLMKRDIVHLGTELGVPLDKTCSCDQPIFDDREGWTACGRCGCCHNRRHAYIQAGISDPQEYAYDMIDTYPSIKKVGKTDYDDIVSRLQRPSEFRDVDSVRVLWELAEGKGE